MRFVAIMDPAEHWLVYDEVAGMPAERDGKVFIGLSREAAERLASEANLAWLRGLDGSLTEPGLRISTVDQRRRA